MSLSLKQLHDVCLLHSGNYKRCRYLTQDELDMGKWYCLKKSSKKSEIDDELSIFLTEINKNGMNPYKQGVPLGDNCNGYPILKFISQGYDEDD